MKVNCSRFELRKMLYRIALSVFLLVAALVLLPHNSQADSVNVALGKPVTGSGYYDHAGDEFPFDNVTDGRYNDSGTVHDWSFWLTRNLTADHFTIDLGMDYLVSKFILQNTYNRSAYDRATVDFRIELAPQGGSYVKVVDSTLPYLGYPYPIPMETFTITPTIGRYVHFIVDSYYSWGGGLNELEVYGQPVPLPSAVLLLGSGLIGLVGWRRFRKS